MNLEFIYRNPNGQAKQRPLLFVHGKWHGAWCWDEHFLPYFATNGYDCTAFSLRGHAGSEGHKRLRWHSIADYVSDLEQVVTQLGTAPIIIAHSMGGYITQKYLEKHPEIPAAVLLTPIPPFGLWPTTFKLLFQKPLVVLKVLATFRLYPVIENTKLARWALFSDSMPVKLVEKYRLQMGDESFRSYLDELGLNLVHTKRVKTPVLVIGAENDTVIFPGLVKSTARAYGTEAEIIPDMAHDVMLDTGWEMVAKRILRWLDTQGF